MTRPNAALLGKQGIKTLCLARPPCSSYWRLFGVEDRFLTEFLLMESNG